MSVFSQNAQNACATLFQINKIIQEKHYKPRPIDDSLSVYVFEEFLDKLDENNTLFLASEINILKKNKFKIDDNILNQKCDFLDVIYENYLKSITRNQATINAITKDSFEYSSKELIRFYKKKQTYRNSDLEIKKIFKKRMLFELLSNISQVSTNNDSIIKNFSSIANTEKTKIFDNYECEFKNKTLTKTQFYSLFINVFCTYFDPHSAYFSSSEKSDFLSGLSANNYSFGINMSISKKNEMVVEEIVPFGAAYFSDKIDVGDIIQKIKIGDTEYNMNCNGLQDIDKVLNSNDTKSAVFTFRKNSGTIYSIVLNKILTRDAYNNVYSYLLEYQNKKTGYIKIPSFYSKFENGKTNMSDDFKKEILKLNDQKITNLVIDLENNTGGSMQEAIRLCGFFLLAPIIGQEKHSKNLQFIIGNESQKPIFKGNIVILINGFSASASEFFTNAMQDYNMAIVLGTKSLGKASMQEILEIDNEAKDFLKITSGTFYRVTGKTNQLVGIEPNIVIPNVFDDQIPREQKSKRALKPEKIKSLVDSNSFPLSEKIKNTIKNYQLEINKENNIKDIVNLKKRVNKMLGNDLEPVALNFNSVANYIKNYNNFWKDIENFSKTEYNFKILTNGIDFETSKKNEIVIDKSKIGYQNIKSNFAIFESLKLLNKMD